MWHSTIRLALVTSGKTIELSSERALITKSAHWCRDFSNSIFLDLTRDFKSLERCSQVVAKTETGISTTTDFRSFICAFVLISMKFSGFAWSNKAISMVPSKRFFICLCTPVEFTQVTALYLGSDCFTWLLDGKQTEYSAERLEP